MATKPLTIAATADKWYLAREARLAADKHAAELKKIETALADTLINSLQKDTTGVAGKIVRVNVDMEEVPKIEDRDQFMSWVAKHKAWEFIPASINKAPMKEAWENGEKIPGTSSIFVPKLHFSKL